jgi:DNA invertase Pin-like site-specific DNA recombinase
MPNIAVYIRVSTAGQSYDSQLEVINRWLKGHKLKATIYQDKSTRDNLNRPAFKKLQAAIFNGEVDTVVVYKLDRLAGTLRDGVATLADWLERGVRLVSVSQEFDFSGKVGQLVAAVLFSISEMEQETRRERQAAGISAAKKRGVYKGSKPGFTKANPADVHKLRGKGLNDSQIGKALGISRATVQRYLRSANAAMTK